jgi:hypothetical protein
LSRQQADAKKGRNCVRPFLDMSCELAGELLFIRTSQPTPY